MTGMKTEIFNILLHAEIDVREIIDWGNCCWGNWLLGKLLLGKLLLGKLRLGTNLTPLYVLFNN